MLGKDHWYACYWQSVKGRVSKQQFVTGAYMATNGTTVSILTKLSLARKV